MINVVKYNLYRAAKNKIVLILFAMCIVLGGTVTAVSQYLGGSGGFDFSLIVLAVIVPSMIYADYKDGIIRNKIIAGNSRRGLYIANLISSIVIGASFWLVYQAVLIIIMNAMPGTPMFTGLHAIVYLCIGIVAVAALCSIFTFIAVNFRSHYSIIVCIFVYGVSLLISSYVLNNAMPMSGYSIKSVLYNLVPIGQLLLIEKTVPKYCWSLPLLSVLVIAVITFIGNLLFEKKDLK